MKKILILLFACLLVLCSCKNEKAPDIYPVNSFGISFEERPSRVICLNPQGREIISVLGYGHALLDTEGAFEDSEYPKADEILSLKPDFAIISDNTQSSVKKALEENGIKSITMERFSSTQELLDFLDGISLIFEGSQDWEKKKEQLAFYFNETENALITSAQELVQERFSEKSPTFLFVTGDNFAMTPETMESKFLEQAGFVNLAKDRENYYVPFSELEQKPDILIYPEHLENMPQLFEAQTAVSYDYERLLHQSPSVFSFRKEILEGIFGEEIIVENNFMMPSQDQEEQKAD